MPTSSSPSGALGHRIQILRRKRKWSQGDLAARVGATRPQISRYESGGYEPRPEMLGRIADALETTADFLITGRDPKTVRDTQLEALLPKLDRLPDELRGTLVEFLESLLQIHQLTQLRRKAERITRKPAG
ncbi:MAG: helix-turn-helix domain-containing protein [Thermoanaerobaculia bacterium]